MWLRYHLVDDAKLLDVFSMFDSSTNAYMLMYRRVQAGATGDRFVEFSEMPGHIVRLVHDIKTHEEIEKIRKEIERNSCRVSKPFMQ